MEFTINFLWMFMLDLGHASPVLLTLIAIISIIGYRIGKIEGWSLSESLYHAFIAATTVGYGDYRPTKKSTRAMAIALAMIGLILTGAIVAIALHAADYAYGMVYDGGGLWNGNRASDAAQ